MAMGFQWLKINMLNLGKANRGIIIDLSFDTLAHNGRVFKRIERKCLHPT